MHKSLAVTATAMYVFDVGGGGVVLQILTIWHAASQWSKQGGQLSRGQFMSIEDNTTFYITYYYCICMLKLKGRHSGICYRLIYDHKFIKK